MDKKIINSENPCEPASVAKSKCDAPFIIYYSLFQQPFGKPLFYLPRIMS